MSVKTAEQKKSDYFCKSFKRIAPDSIKNNWPAPDDGCHETTLQWHVGSGTGNGNGWGGI